MRQFTKLFLAFSLSLLPTAGGLKQPAFCAESWVSGGNATAGPTSSPSTPRAASSNSSPAPASTEQAPPAQFSAASADKTSTHSSPTASREQTSTAVPSATESTDKPGAHPAAAATTNNQFTVRSGSTLLPSEPLPGPYEADRRKIRNWLVAANKKGVGLGAYLPVWNDIEGAVQTGASENDIKAKIDSICRSIENQVRESSKAQAFRPVKPKPDLDKDVEIIRVKWVGEKGSDPLFRDKADKWYNNAVDLLPREQRSDPIIRRKLHDQRDQIFKEMHSRWASGERSWGPRQYVNMNKDMNQARGDFKGVQTKMQQQEAARND